MPLALAVIVIGIFGSVALGAIVATGWCRLHNTGFFYDSRKDFSDAMCLTTVGGFVITVAIVIAAGAGGADWFELRPMPEAPVVELAAPEGNQQ